MGHLVSKVYWAFWGSVRLVHSLFWLWADSCIVSLPNDQGTLQNKRGGQNMIWVLSAMGLILGSSVGWYVGMYLFSEMGLYVILITAACGVMGAALVPWALRVGAIRLGREFQQMSEAHLKATLIGLFLGLAAAALLSFPLSPLPSPWRMILPGALSLTLAYVGAVSLQMAPSSSLSGNRWRASQDKEESYRDRGVLLDTSVIIDGRIADISRTGFIRGTMLIPRFVLKELQHIADSSDILRRNRGRRGLDMLHRLQKESVVPIRTTDMDTDESEEVDGKLVVLARELRCPIITNDYNLNRVAELQGVIVLNINELANAVKTFFLPGESLQVHIMQEGKEMGQGVGYLDDGTMVVVEDGRRYIDQTKEVIVTKALQTAAGRMVFARVK